MEHETLQFLEQFLHAFGVPINRIDLPFSDSDITRLGLNRQILDLDINKLNARISNAKEAVIYQFKDRLECHYTVFLVPRKKELVIIGPLLLEEIKGARFDELFTNLGLPESMRQPLQDFFYGLKRTNYGPEFEVLANIVGDAVFGEGQYEVIHLGSSRDSIYSYTHDRLDDEESLIHTFRYADERNQVAEELLSAVSSGNVMLATQHLTTLQSHMMFPYLLDELRMSQNDCIALNTLLQHTAVQSRVPAVHIDTLYIRYMTQIEELHTVQQCKNIQQEMVQNYCQLISEYNLRQYSPLVRKTISYITSDLTEDLSLKTLASRVNVNPSYLSTLFRQEVGMPLTEYVNRRRIDYAEHLLANSDLDLKSITALCGIHDIQYFNKLFKRYKGITPKAYKDTMEDSTYAVSRLPDFKDQ